MGLKLITPPTGYPVTTAEAKAHLRVDHTDDDDYIDGLIAGVTGMVEGAKGHTGRALLQQTWDYYQDCFPRWCDPNPRVIEVPLPPLISVAGVFYLDANGAEQEFSTDKYSVDVNSEHGRVILKSGQCWPTSYGPDALRIRFTAGYIDAGNSPPTDNVPPAIKSAILLFIGDLYQNRENTVVGDVIGKLPFASECLLKPYVVHRGFA